ncbi:hypothetical protein [Pedobacter sp. NJ-S-72]
MKKILFPALILITSLLACKKTETVEKIVEKPIEVQVPGNPLKTVATQIIISVGAQAGQDYYTPLKDNVKKLAASVGSSTYGFYIYYGSNDFDTLFGQTNGKKVVFILCVNKDWTVNAVFSLDRSGTGDPNRGNGSIKSTNARPNLVPTNAGFYNNSLSGFMTQGDISAL